MAKGVLTALAVMLICTVIPIAQVLLAPFGPFLGAYYGIRSVDTGDRCAAAGRGLVRLRGWSGVGADTGGNRNRLDPCAAHTRPVRDSSLDCSGSVLGLRGRHEHAGRPLPPDQNANRRNRSGVRNGLKHGFGVALRSAGRGTRWERTRVRRGAYPAGTAVPGPGLCPPGPSPAAAHGLARGSDGARKDAGADRRDRASFGRAGSSRAGDPRVPRKHTERFRQPFRRRSTGSWPGALWFPQIRRARHRTRGCLLSPPALPICRWPRKQQ